MREIPKPFEVYRHFKGNVYQIMTIATDSEEERFMVVYQALYGDYKVYVRPLDSFMSLVDSEKYPNAQQKYRFELVQTGNVGTKPSNLGECDLALEKVASTQQASAATQQKIVEDVEPVTSREIEEPELDPIILEYLDAKTVDEKLNILTGAHHKITDEMIDVMAACSDVEVDKGPIEERYESLKTCLLTKQKFEKVRLFS